VFLYERKNKNEIQRRNRNRENSKFETSEFPEDRAYVTAYVTTIQVCTCKKKDFSGLKREDEVYLWNSKIWCTYEVQVLTCSFYPQPGTVHVEKRTSMNSDWGRRGKGYPLEFSRFQSEWLITFDLTSSEWLNGVLMKWNKWGKYQSVKTIECKDRGSETMLVIRNQFQQLLAEDSRFNLHRNWN
jgi:hypothetical protein